MNVQTRQVEHFVIDPSGVALTLEREAAQALYRNLGRALGVPTFEYRGCDNRLSHGAHAWGKNDAYYCHGRSFDAT